MNVLKDWTLRLLGDWYRRGPGSVWIVAVSCSIFFIAALVYVLVYLVAPLPRAPFASELLFTTTEDGANESSEHVLPNWLNQVEEAKESNDDATNSSLKNLQTAGPAEVVMSIVVPAFNEEHRLRDMLEEAAGYLNEQYPPRKQQESKSGVRQRKTATERTATSLEGWEILIISDGSTDKTVAVALDFAKTHSGGSVRVVKLEKNRGKGGAVMWGMKHARGQYVAFADADGASKFSDLGKLVAACESIQDSNGRGVAIGSRAHLVGSKEVVNRSAIRNFLMHSFHLLIWLATPQATSQIKDTQCGFKLFSRPSLPFIVPHMHSEGWIFDVEMLMLAERANIPVKEVAIGWHEVKGSKLNVVRDSLGMAWTLLVLRAAWAMGVYQTEDTLGGQSLEEFLKPNANPLRHKNLTKLLR